MTARISFTVGKEKDGRWCPALSFSFGSGPQAVQWLHPPPSLATPLLGHLEINQQKLQKIENSLLLCTCVFWAALIAVRCRMWSVDFGLDMPENEGYSHRLLGVDKHSPWRGKGWRCATGRAGTLTEHCAGNGRVMGHPQVGHPQVEQQDPCRFPDTLWTHCQQLMPGSCSLVSGSTSSHACLSKKQSTDSQRQLLPFVWVSGCRARVSREQGRNRVPGESGLEHSSPKGADYSYSGNLWGVCA